MTDRIQQALDGELAVAELSPPERAEFEQYRAIVCSALTPIQHLEPIDVTAAVRRRVSPALFRRALDGMIRTVWSPRAFTLRPAVGFAALLAAVLLWRSAPRSPQPATRLAGRVVVQFRLGDPQAREVALVGDFNGWKPAHRLHRIADGVWTVDVALPPGVYNYVFMVDGTTLRLDPLAPHVTDGFGGASSRVSVLAPEPRS